MRTTTKPPSKLQLEFREISQRLHNMPLPDIDLVVGIATGGVVPASLLAHQLACPLAFLHLNYRDLDNQPRYAAPQLVQGLHLAGPPKRILLVDDVSVSGRTLGLAKQLLERHHLTTLVLKGHADHVVFPEIQACVAWPWKTF